MQQSRKDPLRSQPLTPTTIRDARDTHDADRYQFPAPGRLPRRVDTSSGQQSPQYPAHPSVRIPPNVKARGMPMGVGVAPRPAKGTPATYAQDRSTRQRGNSTPKSPWESSQENLSLTMHAPPPVPPSSSSSRRYNMTQSYVSSIGGPDSPAPPAPPLKQTLPPRESHYPEDDSPLPAFPSSRLMPQMEFPTPPDNRATMQTVDSYEQFNNSRNKPRAIDTSMRPLTGPKLGEISPASTRANAMNALSQAIAIGIQPSKPVSPMTMSRRTSRPFSPVVRMPFDDDMNSIYTTNEDLDPPDLKDAPPVPKSKMNIRGLSTSPASSEAPILGLGIGAPGRGLSTKRDASKRPPRLDIDAVRDMEARGSTTSLTDLIKRATKLASNLDRGKTASRLGMLDMFGRSNERLGNLPPGKRDSSMSDMLSAFPAPAIGTPRSEWPGNEKGFNNSTNALPQYKSDSSSTSSGRKAGRRRICGMTVPCFTVVIIMLILLIAAAVLIPIFLIVVPRQSANNSSSPASLAACSDTNKCENSGTTIFTSGVCGCICSGGFTGPTCATPGDSSCTTRNIQDGSVVYTDATMGQQVLQAFNDAGTFRIALNATTILAQFSSNNVPCREANDLLDVNDSENATSTTNAAKRETAPEPFVMLKGYEPAPLPVHPHRVKSIQHNTDNVIAPLVTAAPDMAYLLARQASTTSQSLFSEIDGIVFDTARNTVVTTGPSSTASGASATSTASPDSGSGNAPPSSDLSAQISFARVVILYVIDKSQSLATALDAKNRLAKYFDSVGSGDEVQVGMVAGLMVTADMQNLILRDGDREVNGSS